MGLLFFEGFDYLPTSLNSNAAERARVLGAANFYGFQTASPPKIEAGGRFAYGNYCKLDIFSIGKAFTSNGNITTGFAFYLKEVNGPGSPELVGQVRIYFIDTGTSDRLGEVQLCDYGVVKAFDVNGDQIGASEPNRYTVNSWNFCEIHFVAGSTGSVEVRINATTVLSIPVADFQPSTYYGVSAMTFTVSSARECWIDDWYLLDTEGSVNTGYLGNVRVQFLPLDGTGNQTEWSPSNAGDPNWENANNLLVDDASFVYNPDGEQGDYDLYSCQALINSPNIYGVLVKGAYRQTDATQQFAQNALRTNGSDFFGESVGVSADQYSYIDDVYDLNPATSAGWTYSEVNSIEIGPKHGVAP